MFSERIFGKRQSSNVENAGRCLWYIEEEFGEYDLLRNIYESKNLY
jgi:hypothetical protein